MKGASVEKEPKDYWACSVCTLHNFYEINKSPRCEACSSDTRPKSRPKLRSQSKPKPKPPASSKPRAKAKPEPKTAKTKVKAKNLGTYDLTGGSEDESLATGDQAARCLKAQGQGKAEAQNGQGVNTARNTRSALPQPCDSDDSSDAGDTQVWDVKSSIGQDSVRNGVQQNANSSNQTRKRKNRHSMDQFVIKRTRDGESPKATTARSDHKLPDAIALCLPVQAICDLEGAALSVFDEHQLDAWHDLGPHLHNRQLLFGPGPGHHRAPHTEKIPQVLLDIFVHARSALIKVPGFGAVPARPSGCAINRYPSTPSGSGLGPHRDKGEWRPLVVGVTLVEARDMAFSNGYKERATRRHRITTEPGSVYAFRDEMYTQWYHESIKKGPLQERTIYSITYRFTPNDHTNRPWKGQPKWDPKKLGRRKQLIDAVKASPAYRACPDVQRPKTPYRFNHSCTEDQFAQEVERWKNEVEVVARKGTSANDSSKTATPPSASSVSTSRSSINTVHHMAVSNSPTTTSAPVSPVPATVTVPETASPKSPSSRESSSSSSSRPSKLFRPLPSSSSSSAAAVQSSHEKKQPTASPASARNKTASVTRDNSIRIATRTPGGSVSTKSGKREGEDGGWNTKKRRTQATGKRREPVHHALKVHPPPSPQPTFNDSTTRRPEHSASASSRATLNTPTAEPQAPATPQPPPKMPGLMPRESPCPTSSANSTCTTEAAVTTPAAAAAKDDGALQDSDETVDEHEADGKDGSDAHDDDDELMGTHELTDLQQLDDFFGTS